MAFTLAGYNLEAVHSFLAKGAESTVAPLKRKEEASQWDLG